MNKPTTRGHVRKRGKKWTASVTLPSGPNGERRTKWLGSFLTHREAERAKTKALRELDTHAFNDSRGVTVAQFLERWLRDYADVYCGEKTVHVWRGHLRRHVAPYVGTLPLGQLTPAALQALYARLLREGRQGGAGGLSGTTTYVIHRLLHRLLGHAVTWGLLAVNPAAAVEAPRPTKAHPAALSAPHAAALLDAARTQAPALYPVILTAIGTGLRRGELLGLKWVDVDLERHRLTVNQSLSQVPGKVFTKLPKSPTSLRVVPVPRLVAEELTRHRARQAERRLRLGAEYDDRGFVFAGERGGVWTPNAFSTSWHEFVATSGVAHTSFHALRHTYASHLLHGNASMKIVQKLLGHAGISTTMDIYGHLLGGEAEAAAETMDGVLTKMGRG